jgi:hypothetical protein
MGELCQQLGRKQYVQELTHDAGHTLDLVLSNFDITEEYLFHHHPYYSDTDHDAVCLLVPKDNLLPIEVEQRVLEEEAEPMEVAIPQWRKEKQTRNYHTRTTYLSKVVHIYDLERGWSSANEHYTQQNSYIDYSIENLVKAENPKYIVCL